MIRKILMYLSGYVRVSIDRADYERCVMALYSDKITPIKGHKGDGDFSYFDFEQKIASQALLSIEKASISVKSKKEYGAARLLSRYRKRPGIFIGAVFVIISLIISQNFIWCINIKGLDRLKREDVLELLETHGVYIGCYTPSLSLHRLYNDILIDCKDLCWISVNIRGSVANVEIRETQPPIKLTPYSGKCANLVAKCDGKITRINARDGENSISVGDSVRAGELLVSGLYDDKMGRLVHTYAYGEVYANVRESFYTEIPLEYKKKVRTGEKTEDFLLKIFSKTINIRNNSRKTQTSYDIIEENEQLCLFERIYIPVSYKRVVYYECTDVPCKRNEQTALKIAHETVNRQILEFVGDGVILEKDYDGRLENGVYKLTAHVYANTNIAKVQEFVYNEG